MKTKPYKKEENNQSGKVCEPVVAYTSSEKISINELGISTNTFNKFVERAENDFNDGQYTTSADLLHKIKQQRGWL